MITIIQKSIIPVMHVFVVRVLVAVVSGKESQLTCREDLRFSTCLSSWKEAGWGYWNLDLLDKSPKHQLSDYLRQHSRNTTNQSCWTGIFSFFYYNVSKMQTLIHTKHSSPHKTGWVHTVMPGSGYAFREVEPCVWWNPSALASSVMLFDWPQMLYEENI